MAKPKKTSSNAKPSVKIPDLKPAQNPKGGVTVSDLTIMKTDDKASSNLMIPVQPSPPVKK